MANLEQTDKQYLWHPFTQMKDWLENNQLIIERGDGVYLYDTKGNKYIDGVSSLWVNVHGHRHKKLNRTIKKQFDKIAHTTLLGLGSVPSIELAKKLVEITPKELDKVFYSDSGSTAVEIALKIAFQYQQQIGQTKKKKFITLDNAYHGDTIGSVSVGGIDLFHKIYKPLLFKSIKVRPETKAIEQAMKKHHQEIAAIIMEPLIQGAAGMLLLPEGLLKAVRRLCDKYNILMIVDEVATGFGRTGKMFACEHEGVSPDIMCLAKGITGGYLPLAATLTTQEVYAAFLGGHEELKTFFHGHTYTGNPVACAAALANLEIFKQEKTLQKLQAKIKLLRQELEKFKPLKNVKEVRQLGFMVGIELQGYSFKERIGHQVILEARKRGAILRPLGDVIVLMPPLSISQAELKKLLKITLESISIVKR
ncbi:adenosylmethionine--8-amino-7-oxononanoate transaminase [Candidatus Saganbacteria bacterium CG08_land_8_20_14_0_20_45_16]|uniref:Adenosylmethionine-8-amino-7-oxononanoate aminotransferase n=1 Tax=Candidatus Saganbacteria bacterium CG08_land_8_20_14_0_20_45_16 TaxID=2014293 RepID=A0A2H0XWX0_UNCSA|nr:MAG: adenosylmethionine--8-amino-7-oxononanoate transaminase [Candidatus Saganbacteria bacterium CG08_land_8_20_14_0_20_45_16]